MQVFQLHDTLYLWESSEVFAMEANELLLEVGFQVMEESEKPRSYDNILQRISVAVQRGNVTGHLGSIPRNDFVILDC